MGQGAASTAEAWKHESTVGLRGTAAGVSDKTLDLSGGWVFMSTPKSLALFP